MTAEPGARLLAAYRDGLGGALDASEIRRRPLDAARAKRLRERLRELHAEPTAPPPTGVGEICADLSWGVAPPDPVAAARSEAFQLNAMLAGIGGRRAERLGEEAFAPVKRILPLVDRLAFDDPTPGLVDAALAPDAGPENWALLNGALAALARLAPALEGGLVILSAPPASAPPSPEARELDAVAGRAAAAVLAALKRPSAVVSPRETLAARCVAAVSEARRRGPRAHPVFRRDASAALLWADLVWLLGRIDLGAVPDEASYEAAAAAWIGDPPPAAKDASEPIDRAAGRAGAAVALASDLSPDPTAIGLEDALAARLGDDVFAERRGLVAAAIADLSGRAETDPPPPLSEAIREAAAALERRGAERLARTALGPAIQAGARVSLRLFAGAATLDAAQADALDAAAARGPAADFAQAAAADRRDGVPCIGHALVVGPRPQVQEG